MYPITFDTLVQMIKERTNYILRLDPDAIGRVHCAVDTISDLYYGAEADPNGFNRIDVRRLWSAKSTRLKMEAVSPIAHLRTICLETVCLASLNSAISLAGSRKLLAEDVKKGIYNVLVRLDRYVHSHRIDQKLEQEAMDKAAQ